MRDRPPGQGQLSRLLARPDPVLREGRLGLLCNQTAYDFEQGEYLFQALDRRGKLRRVFSPEHGLFAELQDQVGLSATETYRDLGLTAEIVSLYGDSEETLVVHPAKLADLDALVVDLQDVGSRYYTFATTLSYLFDAVTAGRRELAIYVLDRPNPAGRQVEGTFLPARFQSFCGRPGLPHRHGLTIGELSRCFLETTGAPVRLEVLPVVGDASPDVAWEIAPSPNMPTPITPLLYSGQCLLEGTNLSEGRGTTRPFEIFGAPWLAWAHGKPVPAFTGGATLRPLRFVPSFHKHAGQTCYGFQIHLTGRPYHSLAHSLRLLRWLREGSGADFQWRTEAYEFRSDLRAIEILAGDQVLLDFLESRCDFADVAAALTAGEDAWLRQAERYLLYDPPLRRSGEPL